MLSASLVVTDVTTTASLVTLFLHLKNDGMKSERLVKRLVRAVNYLDDRTWPNQELNHDCSDLLHVDHRHAHCVHNT